MAFISLTTEQVNANSPLDETLMTQIKDNEDDLNSRLGVQHIVSSLGSTFSIPSSIAIPFDNTKPQISEGTEVLKASILPLSTTNEVEINASVNFGFSPNTTVMEGRTAVLSLFKNGGATAIAAVAVSDSTNLTSTNMHQLTLTHTTIVGTTVASTYSIRIGAGATLSSSLETMMVNGRTGGVESNLGGLYASNLILQEIHST